VTVIHSNEKSNNQKAINTLAGTVNVNVIEKVTVLGVQLERVMLTKEVIKAGGVICKGLLGMDWLKRTGGFRVSFQKGEPKIEFEEQVYFNADQQRSEGDEYIIEKDDLILHRHKVGEDQFRWSVEWKWEKETPASRSIKPGNYGLEKYLGNKNKNKDNQNSKDNIDLNKNNKNIKNNKDNQNSTNNKDNQNSTNNKDNQNSTN
jgi:hypothetical protein